MLQKERLEITNQGELKQSPVPEIEPPKEVANWLEKVEKGDVYLAKPVTDDQTGQTLVTAPSAQQPKIVLPLTRGQLIAGLKQKMNQAIRWLAEWCLRLIKMQPNQVELKSNP